MSKIIKKKLEEEDLILKKKLEERELLLKKKLDEEFLLRDRKAASSRARAVTVGTCFGGTTEIIVRGEDGTILWTPMQPVEVVELIHQLAANVGLHIAVKPRTDFASWREWRITDEQKEHMNGWAPFVNDMTPFMQVGTSGMNPHLDKLLQSGAQIMEYGGGAGGLRDDDPLLQKQPVLVSARTKKSAVRKKEKVEEPTNEAMAAKKDIKR